MLPTFTVKMLITMIHRFKQYLVNRKEERIRREKTWKITLTDNYCIRRPNRYDPRERWYKWADIQVKIFSMLKANFPETHVYIRFTTFLPEHYKDIIEPKYIEKIAVKKNDETVILFPDCEDLNVWKRLLQGAGLVPYARCFFLLKGKPANWKDVVMSLYVEISKTEPGNSLNENKSILSDCPCLCYSVDEDLVIGKIDLPESTVLDILKNLAVEDGLALDVERET
jgi:hypothetical protein